MIQTEISVPDYNDSFSSVVLSGKQYLIRFSYHDRFDYWDFGLFTSQRQPIVQGVKIVPRFPLNLYCSSESLPPGMFCVYSDLERVGRRDFIEGRAVFAYVPIGEEEAP
jgi:hypothetical protein